LKYWKPDSGIPTEGIFDILKFFWVSETISGIIVQA
jgi:hypothetical protein